MTAPALPRLRATTLDITAEVANDVDLLSLIPSTAMPSTICSWLREGDGLVGWGRARRCLTRGGSRFVDAERWWKQVCEAADVRDEVNLPGTGLICFGSFSFSADSQDQSRLVVPEVLIGRRAGRTWRTTITADPAGPDETYAAAYLDSTPAPCAEAAPIQIVAGSVSAQQWPGVIAAAIARIGSGDVDKVVLARDELAKAAVPIDVHRVLSRLAQRYGATWTFAVDGLVGATPEMLVRLLDGKVHSRVLAGTVRRSHASVSLVAEDHPDFKAEHHVDPRLRLISSEKDLEEHAYAVRSVADALAPHCRDLEVPAQPFVLKLPDVYHLASDISGAHIEGATSLRVAAALHPSAAVCGTPAPAAAALIAELEQMDRGRYAGPVGWMDATGDGDWGIALRCGELCDDPRRMRLFAGGGIVAASDPDAELDETQIKLAAMRYALDG
ncbi:MAG: isochorismate synthase [Ornithinimicrobium sp.]